MEFIGVDVSKEALEAGVLASGRRKTFRNSHAGRRQLVRWVRKRTARVRVVVEATATYSEAVALALHEADGVEVMVANPRATKHFALALNRRAKTDALDCLVLARFGAAVEFKPWEPPSDALRRLRALMRRRGQLVRQASAEKVRAKEVRAVGLLDADILEDIEEHIAQLEARAEAMFTRALELAKAHQELDAWRRQLITIPGIANVGALNIIAELGHLPDDLDVRQAVAYAGLDPKTWQSGPVNKRRRISKRGNKRLRTALYLAAWTAPRASSEIRAWRQNLIDRGKPPKLADIAVARKLLHAIVGMRRTGSNWKATGFRT